VTGPDLQRDSGRTGSGARAATLLVGFPGVPGDLEGASRLMMARSSSEAARLAAGAEIGAVCVGPLIAAKREGVAVAEAFERRSRRVVVSGAGAAFHHYEHAVETGRVAFLAAGVLSGRQLALLIRVRTWHVDCPSGPSAALETLGHGDLRLLTRDLTQAEEEEDLGNAVERAAGRFLPGSVARLWFADHAEGTLWSSSGRQKTVFALSTGVAGWTATTGEPVRSRDVADDPRHDPELEGPVEAGLPVLAAPVIDEGGTVSAVIICQRPAQKGGYSARDAAWLGFLAFLAAPSVRGLALETAALNRSAGPGGGWFRPEAWNAWLTRSDWSAPLVPAKPRLTRLLQVVLVLACLGLVIAGFVLARHTAAA